MGSHAMSTTSDTTFELFKQAVLEDEDRGYPDKVSFVPEDLPNVDDVLWRNLHDERRPMVVVRDDDTELLFVPLPRPRLLRWLDDRLGRMSLRVGWRYHELASPYTVRTRVGHRPLADMRRSVPCA
jgi:hypothetical protein